MKFFLIDDDREDQEIFKMALHDLDSSYECKVAGDPLEALSIISDNKDQFPDLIFLDLNMPKMTGLEGIGFLKKDPRTVNIPVYFYSTHNDEKDAREASMAGAAGFIKKPSSIPELSNIFREIINARLKPQE